MFYYYNKDNGKVRMVSVDQIEYNQDLLNIVEIDDNEYEGYSMTYQDNQLTKTKI